MLGTLGKDNCFFLLRLDKDFVAIVQEDKAPAPELGARRVDLMSYLQGLEDKYIPEVIQVEDPLAIPLDSIEPIPEFEGERPAPDRISFTSPDPIELESIPSFDEVRTPEPSQLQRIPSSRDFFSTTPKLEPSKPSKPSTTPEARKLSPAEKRRLRRLEGTVNVVFCPSCSKITTNMEKRCPNCGHLLK